MEIAKLELCENELLKSEVLFIDGLTRVGKSMFNTLVASLDNVTQPQFVEPLEQIIPMCKTGHMSKNAASSFLRLYFNEKLYNFSLSRNMNFRYNDLTSVHNSTFTKKFFENLSRQDGDEVIDELISDKLIHQYQTHDILTHYELFSSMGINAKIVEIFRNPIDTIHSWHVRGWGTRFDTEDPRGFTTLFKFEGKTLPHYAIGYEEEYFTLNPIGKCVFLHNILLKQSIEEYKKLDEVQKEKFLLLKYEDMLTSPDSELDKICEFLQTTKTEYTPRACKDARVPREVKAEDRVRKYNDIKEAVKPSLLKEIEELVAQYDSNLYGLSS